VVLQVEDSFITSLITALTKSMLPSDLIIYAVRLVLIYVSKGVTVR
jgi:hypothetical protein